MIPLDYAVLGWEILISSVNGHADAPAFLDIRDGKRNYD